MASVVAATASCARTETEDEQGSKEVELLFVQNAGAVSLSGGVLTLEGIAADTLYFSDRPERIVGRITTREFTDQWATGDDSFEANPPNAVLSILREPEPQDITMVLGSPEIVGDDLVYGVEILDGNAEATGEACSLFIDIIGRPLTPLSVAGVARRTSRRTARRVDRRR
jgi:hypothetical protein